MQVIRCSSLARPMVCAGFLKLDVEQPPAGDAAKEGTAAGEYLEYLLTNRPLGDVASNGIYFDDDMKFYTRPIYEDVMSRAASKVMCETRIDWRTRSGIMIKGQPDIAFVDHEGTLCIEDLKYGFGIVEVFENWQLLGYAIGEVLRLNQAFHKISLKIHQPRVHHEDGSTREWVLTWQELLEYKEKIEARMDEIANGRDDFQTSSKCKYCKGTAEACPAFNRLFYRALEVSTEFTQDEINEDELSRQLDQIKRAEEVIKIKKDSLTELATMRIKKGKIIPNYIQVEKFSNRKWKKGITPATIKALTGKDAVENNFMSPFKAEKLGVSKELVEQLAEKVRIGVTLKKQNASEVANNIFGNEAPTLN